MSKIIEQILKDKKSRKEPKEALSLMNGEFDVWN